MLQLLHLLLLLKQLLTQGSDLFNVLAPARTLLHALTHLLQAALVESTLVLTLLLQLYINTLLLDSACSYLDAAASYFAICDFCSLSYCFCISFTRSHSCCPRTFNCSSYYPIVCYNLNCICSISSSLALIASFRHAIAASFSLSLLFN